MFLAKMLDYVPLKASRSIAAGKKPSQSQQNNARAKASYFSDFEQVCAGWD